MAPLLRAAGHEVYTPTLTGLGERVHLASPDVDFETHVQDVVNVLVHEDLRDVILVGHSYGGMVTRTVAHRAPERIRQLIRLDAMLPSRGRPADQLYEDHGLHDFIRRVREIVERDGEGWYWPPRSGLTIPACDRSRRHAVDGREIDATSDGYLGDDHSPRQPRGGPDPAHLHCLPAAPTRPLDPHLHQSGAE